VGSGRVQVITAGGSSFVEPPALPADQSDGPSHFLAALAGKADVTPFCSAATGCAVQEVIAAAQRASSTGQRVVLPVA
jgi:hypothetical protein